MHFVPKYLHNFISIISPWACSSLHVHDNVRRRCNSSLMTPPLSNLCLTTCIESDSMRQTRPLKHQGQFKNKWSNSTQISREPRKFLIGILQPTFDMAIKKNRVMGFEKTMWLANLFVLKFKYKEKLKLSPFFSSNVLLLCSCEQLDFARKPLVNFECHLHFKIMFLII